MHWTLCRAILPLLALAAASSAQTRPRARALGVPFEGVPGPLNAITDVAGIAVGHATLISGEGPVRTGVTALLPRGPADFAPVFAGWFSLNGNGEMTGTTWVEESGFAEGPILLTNTHSVGTVRDAAIKWQIRHGVHADSVGNLWSLPIVAETWDGFLNDVNGFHVHESDAFYALDAAAAGPVAEGSVGGGTGMICYGFKGGIGTSSRKLDGAAGGFMVGVLVQCNCGRRPQLRIAGAPVGQEIPGDVPYALNASWAGQDVGSIIILVATDAPLLPHQLKRLARRASLGLARTGSISGNGSGDIFLAFSTANRPPSTDVRMLPNEAMNPLFEATVQATANAMVVAETMTGAEGRNAPSTTALRHDQCASAPSASPSRAARPLRRT